MKEHTYKSIHNEKCEIYNKNNSFDKTEQTQLYLILHFLKRSKMEI